VGVLTFQARLGVIARTLLALGGPVGHVALLLALVTVMLAAAAHIGASGAGRRMGSSHGLGMAGA
jgi:hypothetical protein